MADTITIAGFTVKKTYLLAGAVVAAAGAYYLMYTKSGHQTYDSITGRHPAAQVLPPEI